MKILVTNDDGLFAPGIRALTEVAKEFGDVVVVAPDSPKSGQGHAITIESPIRLKKVNYMDGVEAYECSGTPVDCVKLAKNVLYKNDEISFCFSGINHGSNASINIIYSGTMSAAMEASLEGIPSIGFSLLDYGHDADFKPAQHYARKIIAHCMKNGFGNTMLLNVNIPKMGVDQIKGIKICRQSKAGWKEEFQEGVDPRGQKYYWLTGTFVHDDPGTDDDWTALESGFVTVVPVSSDMTDYQAIVSLESLQKI